MSVGTAEGEVPPAPDAPRSGYTRGDAEIHSSCAGRHSQDRRTSGHGNGEYGTVSVWSLSRCQTCGSDGCDGACLALLGYVFSTPGQNICRIHREYRKFLLNLQSSWEWVFVCNCLIITYKRYKCPISITF